MTSSVMSPRRLREVNGLSWPWCVRLLLQDVLQAVDPIRRPQQAGSTSTHILEVSGAIAPSPAPGSQFDKSDAVCLSYLSSTCLTSQTTHLPAFLTELWNYSKTVCIVGCCYGDTAANLWQLWWCKVSGHLLCAPVPWRYVQLMFPRMFF